MATLGEKLPLFENPAFIAKLEGEDAMREKLWRLDNLYFIKTKQKTLEPMHLNDTQMYWFFNRTLRDFILKARQLGITTAGLIDLLDDTVFGNNTNSAILAHKQNKVIKLFEIVKRAYDYLPPEIKPRVSVENKNELYFPDLESKIFITMDSRSETVHNLHVSELAFIPNAEEIMAGTLESVPEDGKITYETTANGMVGYAFDEWMDDASEFRKHFFPWFWDSTYASPLDGSEEDLMLEYQSLAVRYGLIADLKERFELSPEQMNFYVRRIRRHKALIVQEYPSTALEAFMSSGLNVFHAADLAKHPPKPPILRKWQDFMVWEEPLPGFSYVIGVDPSEGVGGDNAAVCVLNANTGEQVGEFATPNIPPNELATLVIDVARWYNRAYIVPEINSPTFMSHIKTKYSNIYRRKIFDRRVDKNVEALGWRTTGITKPKLVQDLEEAVREEYIAVNSDALLKELRTFVRTDESGHHGYGAEGSNHDDRVIAIGLAYQGIKEVPRVKKPENIAQQKLREYLRQNNINPALPAGSNVQPIAKHRKAYFLRGVNPQP